MESAADVVHFGNEKGCFCVIRRSIKSLREGTRDEGVAERGRPGRITLGLRQITKSTRALLSPSRASARG